LKQTNDGQWVHIFCVCWNEEICFFDNSFMKNPILMENNYHQKKKKKECLICSDCYGITQKCFYSECNVYVHPLCAKRQNYQSLICLDHAENKYQFILFCDQHRNNAKNVELKKKKKEEIKNYDDLIPLHSTNNSEVTDSEHSDDMEVAQNLSLDQKLNKMEIALSKKEVIELLWSRTDRYHETVTTTDYLRIAPHHFYNDPIFGAPLKGKNNFNLYKKRKINDKYTRSFICKSSHFNDSNKKIKKIKKEFNDWTLDGIKSKLSLEMKQNDDEYQQQQIMMDDIDDSLNYFTNSSINKLPKLMDDNEQSLIPHQLGMSLECPPIATFKEMDCDHYEINNNLVWNGNANDYKVEMDPFGWRWVLKHTEIPPNISKISCICLLCKYISNEYHIKREKVQKLTIEIKKYLDSIKPSNSFNINLESEQEQKNEQHQNQNIKTMEPKVLETRPFHKESIDVIIQTKHGRVLSQYTKNTTTKKQKQTQQNDIEYQFETIPNDDTETTNSLQPRSINIIEKIAWKRYAANNENNSSALHSISDINQYRDEPQSIYHIDHYQNKKKQKNKKSPKTQKIRRSEIGHKSYQFR